MESFFGSLKTELVHRTRFSTRREARLRYSSTSRSGRIGEEQPGPDFGVNVSWRELTLPVWCCWLWL